MTDEEIISIAVETSLLNYIDNETPRRFFVSGHAELDDVVSFGRVIAATAFEKASNVMRAEVDYWQKDSASAWDKCEERRIENERLRAREAEWLDVGTDAHGVVARMKAEIERLRAVLEWAAGKLGAHGFPDLAHQARPRAAIGEENSND